jgi:hypothetical protein
MRDRQNSRFDSVRGRRPPRRLDAGTVNLDKVSQLSAPRLWVLAMLANLGLWTLFLWWLLD